jgi:hypothetical protein
MAAPRVGDLAQGDEREHAVHVFVVDQNS